MAKPVNPPRGMRDFLPAEKARREAILQTIRTSYRAHGFQEIETPVAEDAARLHAGLGGDNEKLAFAIMRRGLSPDDLRAAADAGSALDLADLGLRFDLTVPLARFTASHWHELPKPFRAIQIAPVWRAERPQQGRYRQFVQCDIDIIGEAGPLAEVELLTASAQTIRALGITDFTIRVNDRRLLTAVLEHLGFPAAEHELVLIVVDKLDKVGPDGVIAELLERGSNPAAVEALRAHLLRPQTREFIPFGEAQIRKGLPAGLEHAAIAELASIGETVLDALSASNRAKAQDELGVDLPQDWPDAIVGQTAVHFDPWLVRGMGYYTGPIFELAHAELGHSFGGGGRYDGMIGRFLGSEVPATGISLGFERLVDLVSSSDEGTNAVAVVYDTAASPAEIVAARDRFVAEGRVVRLVRRPKQLGKALDQLVAEGIGAFVLVEAGSDAAALELKPLAAR